MQNEIISAGNVQSGGVIKYLMSGEIKINTEAIKKSLTDFDIFFVEMKTLNANDRLLLWKTGSKFLKLLESGRTILREL